MISLRKNHLGFTMIELLIAMLIGTFLLLGVTTMFNTTRQSFQLQNGLAEMSETARFTVDTLTWHTRTAGFRDTEWARGAVSNGLVITNGAGRAPDSISVVYEAPVDCNLDPAVNKFVTMNFQIQRNIGDPGDLTDDTFALTCNQKVLFEDVVDMQILVGEDSDGDGTPDRYREPNAAMAARMIRTLNVNLLVRSDRDNLSDAPINFIQEDDFWSIDPPNDGRLYREYSFNIAIRNLL